MIDYVKGIFLDQTPQQTDIQMQHSEAILPGWNLNWDELANEVYQVRLVSEMGLTVEMTGHDFDGLGSQCVESVKEIEQRLARFASECG